MTQTIDPQVDSLYGGDDVRQRAEAWARARGLRLSDRSRCACGLYRRSDYSGWCSPDDYVLLDHARIWNLDRQPVLLLAHSYASRQQIEELALLYAAQHDLKVTIGDPADDWYGAGAIPIRYERAQVNT